MPDDHGQGSKSTPIALDAYEALAERYAARVDAKPHEEFRLAAPEDYEKLCREPGFLCVRVVKPGEQ